MKKGCGISKGFRDSSRETINFGKSSGGKPEESHFGKLDTSNETSGKNYLGKYIEEKSFSSLNTPTRSEFQRQRTSSENLKTLASKNIFHGRDFIEKKKAGSLTKEKLGSWQHNFFSSTECLAQEKHMKEKLKEIRGLVESIQKKSKKASAVQTENNLFRATPIFVIENEGKLILFLIYFIHNIIIIL